MFKPHTLKRAAFMFIVMFPILLVVEYKGYNLQVWGAILALVTSAISFVIFPDPEYLKKIKEEEEKNEKSGK